MHVHDFHLNPVLDMELEMVTELDSPTILPESATSTIDMPIIDTLKVQLLVQSDLWDNPFFSPDNLSQQANSCDST